MKGFNNESAMLSCHSSTIVPLNFVLVQGEKFTTGFSQGRIYVMKALGSLAGICY